MGTGIEMLRVAGGFGQAGATINNTGINIPTPGSPGFFGRVGPTPQNSAVPGAGGTGGTDTSSNTGSGGSGAAGEFVEFVMTAAQIGGSAPYTVGAPGAGVSASPGVGPSVAGGPGAIFIEEYYN